MYFADFILSCDAVFILWSASSYSPNFVIQRSSSSSSNKVHPSISRVSRTGVTSVYVHFSNCMTYTLEMCVLAVWCYTYFWCDERVLCRLFWCLFSFSMLLLIYIKNVHRREPQFWFPSAAFGGLRLIPTPDGRRDWRVIDACLHHWYKTDFKWESGTQSWQSSTIFLSTF